MIAALVCCTDRATKIDPALVEEIYFGCANQAGEDNRNVARMALIWPASHTRFQR
jgi:acetyl-CoA acetyltransferase